MIRKVFHHSVLVALFLCSLTQTLAETQNQTLAETQLDKDRTEFEESYVATGEAIWIIIIVLVIVGLCTCGYKSADTGLYVIVVGVFIAISVPSAVLYGISAFRGYWGSSLYPGGGISDFLLVWGGICFFALAIALAFALPAGLGTLVFVCYKDNKKKKAEAREAQMGPPDAFQRYRDNRFDVA